MIAIDGGEIAARAAGLVGLVMAWFLSVVRRRAGGRRRTHRQRAPPRVPRAAGQLLLLVVAQDVRERPVRRDEGHVQPREVARAAHRRDGDHDLDAEAVRHLVAQQNLVDQRHEQPAMWNVFRSISRAALATFRMLTPHALSRSFGLRLLLNAMKEKEAMTETEMRYSSTKRLDGCWWGCIVERASAVRCPPSAVASLSQRTSQCISRPRVWISPTLRAHRPLKFKLTRRCEWRFAESGVVTVQNAMQLGRRLNHVSMRAC